MISIGFINKININDIHSDKNISNHILHSRIKNCTDNYCSLKYAFF